MAEKVNELVKEISTNLSQVSSSHKDELRVMKTMLNDPTYEVSVYGTSGIEGTYNPCKDFRSMCSSIVSGAAKIPQAEAETLVENYEIKKSEVGSMVNVSKEFVNTYLKTGRKLPLGGRENSDVSLSLKKVEESVRAYPKKIGVNEDGTDRYSKAPTKVNAHESVRVHAPCPGWLR